MAGAALTIAMSLILAAEYAGYTIEDCEPLGFISEIPAGPSLALFAVRQGGYSSVISRMNEEERFEDWRELKSEPLGGEGLEVELPFGSFGFRLGGLFAHRGEFIRIDEGGEPVNSFPETDLKLWLGTSLPLGRGIWLGYRLSFIRVKLPVGRKNDYGRGLSHDVELGMRAPGRSIRIGAYQLSKGLSFKSDELPNELRRIFRLGLSWAIDAKPPLILDLQLRAPWRFGARFTATATWRLAERLSGTIGYTRETRREKGRFWICRGMVVGVTVGIGQAALGVSLSPQWRPAPLSFERVRDEGFEPKLTVGLISGI